VALFVTEPRVHSDLEGDKPGKPEVVLDGWNMTDTKHNIFKLARLGSGRLALRLQRHSGEGVGRHPGTPKEKRPYMDCGVWRYHPTRKIFEPVAHGTTNPFGLDWDENGEMFITNCVIDHLSTSFRAVTTNACTVRTRTRTPTV